MQPHALVEGVGAKLHTVARGSPAARGIAIQQIEQRTARGNQPGWKTARCDRPKCSSGPHHRRPSSCPSCRHPRARRQVWGHRRALRRHRPHAAHHSAAVALLAQRTAQIDAPAQPGRVLLFQSNRPLIDQGQPAAAIAGDPRRKGHFDGPESKKRKTGGDIVEQLRKYSTRRFELLRNGKVPVGGQFDIALAFTPQIEVPPEIGVTRAVSLRAKS